MPEGYLHTFAVLAYEESPHLEESILSLQRQSVKSIIFISTSTPSNFLIKVSEKFNLPLIVNNNARGIASDWSFAYGNCKTRYLTLAHQDDIYLPRYTECCLSAANKNKRNEFIIFTDYNELLENNMIRKFCLNLFIKRILLIPFLNHSSFSRSIQKMILSISCPIPCPSVMYNKQNIGDFKFREDFSCNMDWDAWVRLFQKKGSFIYIKKRLMLHRIHRASQTSESIKNNVRRREEEEMFKELWPGPISGFLSKLYSFGLRCNSTRSDRR